MTVFFIAAALLVAIALIGILRPLLRPTLVLQNVALERKEANLVIFRDQLAELSREHAAGSLADADFAQAQAELRKRLLSEIPEEQAASSHRITQPARRIAVVIAVLLPLAALGGYHLLGTPRALEPLTAMADVQPTPEQISGMVEQLAQRLKDNPDDMEGWLMLGRSYKSQGRQAEAAEAYAKVEGAMADNPDFLADYADLLAMLAGGRLDGRPMALINKVLHLDPNHLMGLWLAGTAAFDKADFSDAVIFWERALKTLPEGSQDRPILIDSIAEAKRRSGVKLVPGMAVAGRVELAPRLAANTAPDDTVFVFARPLDGSRMPLAVARVRVADLPYSFVLDDTSAMMPDKTISSQSQVIVEARISRLGNAIAAAGDLQSKPVTSKLGERNLHLVVDHAFQP